MQWLNDLSVRNKISGNSLLLLLLMLGSTLYAINSMRSIGSELEAIAEQDIPMTEVLTRITEHQLEQAIHFERAVRYAILLNRDDKAEEHFIKEVNYFNKLNAKVDKEILEGEDHAAKAIENAHTDRGRLGTHHRVSLRTWPRNAHVDHGGHRARSNRRYLDARCRSAGAFRRH